MFQRFLRNKGESKEEKQAALMHNAQTFRHNFHFQTGIWQGVDYLREREEQINDSLRKLRGFSAEMNELSNERWRLFGALLGGAQQLTSIEIFSHCIQKTKYDVPVHRALSGETIVSGWQYNGHFEVHNIISFMPTRRDVISSLTSATQYFSSPQYSLDLTAFLNRVIGHGHTRVRSGQNGSVKGLDKIQKTGHSLNPYAPVLPLQSCPLAKAKEIAVKYFGYSIMDFLLMQAVARELGKLR